MKALTCFSVVAALVFCTGAGIVSAETEVRIDLEKLGKSLGGWKGKSEKFAEYVMADSKYRTFKPDMTPTPDGGVYLSLRIDYVRGLFASDDHAVLELTLDKNGQVQTTRSSVNIQGKRITSDLIAGGVRSAGNVATGTTPAEMVVSLGSSLVANLTEKMSTENKVESGRVTFPSVVQHNFNLVYQAVEVVDRTKAAEDPVAEPVADSTGEIEEALPASPPTPGNEENEEDSPATEETGDPHEGSPSEPGEGE